MSAPRDLASAGASQAGGLAPADFAEWFERLRGTAAIDGVQIDVAVTGVCCWLEYFNDGFSPAEAWNEECRND